MGRINLIKLHPSHPLQVPILFFTARIVRIIIPDIAGVRAPKVTPREAPNKTKRSKRVFLLLSRSIDLLNLEEGVLLSE